MGKAIPNYKTPTKGQMVCDETCQDANSARCDGMVLVM